jgi:hypothetical protein
MKMVLYFLLVCMVMAALQYAIVALAVVFAILLVWACLKNPQEMLGLVVTVAIIGLLQVHPWFCLVVVMIALAVRAFKKAGLPPSEKETLPELLEYQPEVPPPGTTE